MNYITVKRNIKSHPYCTNWTMNPATTPAIVIGNGPTRTLYTEIELKEMGVTYGCNSIRSDFSPDFLVSSDPWAQQEIILEGYCKTYDCIFRDWEPIPSEIDPSEMYHQWPGYITVRHGKRKDAESWFMWANQKDYRLGDDMTAHVVWVPRNSKIESVNSREKSNPKGVRSQGPTGAFAIQSALERGHTKIVLIGFDALKGNYECAQRGEWRESKGMDEWKNDYESLLNKYPNVEIEWR